MILPRLYEGATTDFSNNGLGVLSDAIECKVTQGFGYSYLEMKYPLSGRLASKLSAHKIIYAQPEPGCTPQPYSIYKMVKISNGLLYVYARHVCYNLDGCVVTPFVASSASEAFEKLQEAQTIDFLQKNPFNFDPGPSAIGSLSVSKPTNAWDIIGNMEGSFLQTYGGEIVFDGYNVRRVSRRGTDRGLSIRYGKNLISLEQEENISKTYSGIFAYFGSGSTTATKYIHYSGIKQPIIRLLPVDFTDELGDTANLLTLQEAAEKYAEKYKVGIPEVNITVQFSTIRNHGHYEDVKQLERVSVGDTVNVYFPKFEINATARAQETVYDCLRGKYDTVQIGSVKETLSDFIAKQRRDIDIIAKKI